jgi:tetratricopeptide (TPR) repeat protein
VTQAVLEVNAYLRHQTSGMRGRHFQVFVELLAAPNQIQTRSYGVENTIVLTPSIEPQVRDVRHAYLHYMLDPLPMRAEETLARKKAIIDHALRAPALDESFKTDFALLVSECLIKAVEARLDRKPAEVDEALKEGYILAPYFAEQLRAYEQQETAMQFYFPDMAKALDLRKEDARLSKVEFNAQARVRPARTAPAPPPPPALSGAAKTIEDAEQLYTARDLDKARELFLRVLQETGDRTLHARAYYGLARVASLKKDPETAEQLFAKTLASAPDAQVKAWALVYLGRLADARGERDEAVKYFEGALQVEGASEAARQAAGLGAQQTAGKPAQP